MFEVLDGVCTPTKGSKYSACVDLYARKDVTIGAGETVLVPLGIKIDLEYLKENLPMCKWARRRKVEEKDLKEILKQEVDSFMRRHQLNLHIRSSLSAKHGLIIANGTGIIDLDYPGEIMICLHKPINKGDDFDTNGYVIGFDDEDFGYKIEKGQKIAQISLVEHKSYLLGVESKEERTGGFGSTDA